MINPREELEKDILDACKKFKLKTGVDVGSVEFTYSSHDITRTGVYENILMLMRVKFI
jgi:hypothetical protein